MNKDRKPGIVSLQKIFDDLERAEKIIKINLANLQSDEINRSISILKEIKDELTPLAEERNVVELELIMEDINLALDILSEGGDTSKVLESLESAKINLTQYNLKGRKDIES